MQQDERQERPERQHGNNPFTRKMLEGACQLENKVWVYYPNTKKLSQNRKDKLVEFSNHLSDTFGQPIFAIYMNPNQENDEFLWDIRFKFRHTADGRQFRS